MSDVKNILSKVTASCKYLLSNGASSQVLEYIDSRISKESQNLFDIGYYPSISNISLLTNLINKETLKSGGLLFSKQIEDSLFPRLVDFSFFENYPLIMPYKDAYGSIQGIVGRSLLQDDIRKSLDISKYKNTNSFHKSEHLFGLYENKEHIELLGYAYIVEGQFDVIKAYENGIRNIVAVGSCNMSDKQMALLNRYTDNFYLLFDNDGKDGPGDKGRKKIIKKFNKHVKIKNAYINKKFKDLDEYLESLNGKDPDITIAL